jgi:hypothetical protein
MLLTNWWNAGISESPTRETAVSDILIAAEDKDGNRHWSEVYSDEYQVEELLERARNDMVWRPGNDPVFMRAYRIEELPFASMEDKDGAEVRRHNWEDVG